MEIINKYEPKHPESAEGTIVEASWDGIFDRVLRYNDDGHAAKLVRALAHGEDICAAYSMNDPLYRIKGDVSYYSRASFFFFFMLWGPETISTPLILEPF